MFTDFCQNNAPSVEESLLPLSGRSPSSKGEMQIYRRPRSYLQAPPSAAQNILKTLSKYITTVTNAECVLAPQMVQDRFLRRLEVTLQLRQNVDAFLFHCRRRLFLNSHCSWICRYWNADGYSF